MDTMIGNIEKQTDADLRIREGVVGADTSMLQTSLANLLHDISLTSLSTSHGQSEGSDSREANPITVGDRGEDATKPPPSRDDPPASADSSEARLPDAETGSKETAPPATMTNASLADASANQVISLPPKLVVLQDTQETSAAIRQASGKADFMEKVPAESRSTEKLLDKRPARRKGLTLITNVQTI